MSGFSDDSWPRPEISALCAQSLRVQAIVDELAALKTALYKADSKFDGTADSLRGVRFR